jgi:hypothetical protein
MRAIVDAGGKSASQCSQLGLSFNMTCASNYPRKPGYVPATSAAVRQCRKKTRRPTPHTIRNMLIYSNKAFAQRIRPQSVVATEVYANLP